jgi:hypothetical protein
MRSEDVRVGTDASSVQPQSGDAFIFASEETPEVFRRTLAGRGRPGLKPMHFFGLLTRP